MIYKRITKMAPSLSDLLLSGVLASAMVGFLGSSCGGEKGNKLTISKDLEGVGPEIENGKNSFDQIEKNIEETIRDLYKRSKVAEQSKAWLGHEVPEVHSKAKSLFEDYLEGKVIHKSNHNSALLEVFLNKESVFFNESTFEKFEGSNMVNKKGAGLQELIVETSRKIFQHVKESSKYGIYKLLKDGLEDAKSIIDDEVFLIQAKTNLKENHITINAINNLSPFNIKTTQDGITSVTLTNFGSTIKDFDKKKELVKNPILGEDYIPATHLEKNNPAWRNLVLLTLKELNKNNNTITNINEDDLQTLYLVDNNDVQGSSLLDHIISSCLTIKDKLGVKIANFNQGAQKNKPLVKVDNIRSAIDKMKDTIKKTYDDANNDNLEVIRNFANNNEKNFSMCEKIVELFNCLDKSVASKNNLSKTKATFDKELKDLSS